MLSYRKYEDPVLFDGAAASEEGDEENYDSQDNRGCWSKIDVVFVRY